MEVRPVALQTGGMQLSAFDVFVLNLFVILYWCRQYTQLFDILMCHLCLSNFVSPTGLHSPPPWRCQVVTALHHVLNTVSLSCHYTDPSSLLMM